MNKYLAHCGVCSRRDADKLIEKGQVLVNGRTALPGMAVGDEDEVLVSGRRVSPGQETVVLAFHKPLGVTCTERDRHAERIVSDLVDYPVRVTYAGRLDKDSEGLLLLSNDGDLIQAMMKGATAMRRSTWCGSIRKSRRNSWRSWREACTWRSWTSPPGSAGWSR